ncbi:MULTISPECIES: hypothetical protein [Vibrio]|uniref:hypothetical protein n=1 Tax=Vibrio TaxID=662 RepID=UPI0020763BEB|nr:MULTISPECIES: hypothetical protein [Vibrio]USD35461.1 hypothetical protein J8Z27_22850 [Vibrio sp. SCSIO 43186]USD72585.1 hypothetical protein J4N41_22855 [Vibrio sp. SCSIO 43139]USD98978.1 hypothetical protein CTT30_23175 [Vibrio coralliilyticus]
MKFTSIITALTLCLLTSVANASCKFGDVEIEPHLQVSYFSPDLAHEIAERKVKMGQSETYEQAMEYINQKPTIAHIILYCEISYEVKDGEVTASGYALVRG